MRSLKHLTIIIFIVAALPLTGSAADPAVVEAFKSAPAQIIPLLTKSTRLDMIDYYNNNLETPSENLMNGKSRITEINDRSIMIELTSASTLQIISLPAANKEYIALISTIDTPAPDSKMTIYTDDWKQIVTDKLFRTPEVKDWLTPEGKKHADEVDMVIPFMLVSYNFDGRNLTLHNNTQSFLAREVWDDIKPYMLDSISYTWNGKKFERNK